MRTASQTAFRPALEPVEARVLTTSGITHPPAHHPAHHAPPHHAAPKPEPAPAPTPAPASAINPARTAPSPDAGPHAWVELVNMTGEDLNYQISLAPYANGAFLPFTIAGQGGDSTQYRAAALDVGGQQRPANFQIQFGQEPATPLLSGPTQATAQGYYIFLDGNNQPYLAAFTRLTSSY